MPDKVFITNKGGHDFSKAERFGDLVFLTSGRVDIYHTDRLVQERIIPGLEGARKTDYLLVSGNPAITAMCLAIWLDRFGEARVLFWDSLYQDYILREFKGGSWSSQEEK